MEGISTRVVVVDGREIRYRLEQKMVKNLNLRIRKDGSVLVSANENVPLDEIDQFVRSKASYALTALRDFKAMAEYKPHPKQYVSGETFYIQGRALRLKVSQATKDSIVADGVNILLSVVDAADYEKKKHVVSRFLDKQCRIVFGEVLEELYPQFRKYEVANPVLRIRNMETRWGSCSPKRGVITLNKRLLEAPRNCIEYVLMHELCHFLHPNHSKHFYAFLTMMMPDWKERKEFLDKTAVYWL